MTPDTAWKVCHGTAHTEHDGIVYVLAPEATQPLALNQTASLCWHALIGNTTHAATLQLAQDRSLRHSDIHQEVTEVARILEEMGAIENNST